MSKNRILEIPVIKEIKEAKTRDAVSQDIEPPASLSVIFN